MLLNFSVKNYRSFRDEVTLSLAASSERTHSKAIHRRGAARVLPVAVIYGANSSGKTNVLYALRQLNHVVKSSVKLNPPTPSTSSHSFLTKTHKTNPPNSKSKYSSPTPATATASNTMPNVSAANGSTQSSRKNANSIYSSASATNSKYRQNDFPKASEKKWQHCPTAFSSAW